MAKQAGSPRRGAVPTARQIAGSHTDQSLRSLPLKVNRVKSNGVVLQQQSPRGWRRPPRRPSIFGLAASTSLPTSTIPTLCTLGRPRPTRFACQQCWGPVCMVQHSSAMSDMVPGKQSAVPTSADCMIAWHRQQGGVIHNDVIMQHIANRQSERASFFTPAPRRRVSANSRETTYRIT